MENKYPVNDDELNRIAYILRITQEAYGVLIQGEVHYEYLYPCRKSWIDSVIKEVEYLKKAIDNTKLTRESPADK